MSTTSEPGAAQLVAAIADDLPGSPGQAHRWLADWLAGLTEASRVLGRPAPDLTALPETWAALVAGSIRYRLRLLDVPQARMPDWTDVAPLEQFWFGQEPGHPVLARRATKSITQAPAELRRLGVFMPASALLPAHLRENTEPTMHDHSHSHATHLSQENTAMSAQTLDYQTQDQAGSTAHLRKLDSTEILQALKCLGQHLDESGHSADIAIVGGAAIALTLGSGHRVTADVDAVVLDNHTAFERAAARTAGELDLDPSWISEDISQFVSQNPAGEQTLIVLPGLNVYVASPEHLLALKVRAAAGRGAGADYGDLSLLIEHLGLTGDGAARAIAELTAQQFSGVYELSLGTDEYLDVAREVLMHYDIAQGLDPAARMLADMTAEG